MSEQVHITDRNRADTVLYQFNATIEQWIAYLDDYTLKLLYKRPRMETWSLGQVYTHIIDDTRYYVEQVKGALNSTVNRDREMHEDAKEMFVNNAFPDKLLVNPFAGLDIRQPESKEAVRQDLLSIQQEIMHLYTTFDFSASRGKTEHPGLLFLSALEWLQFAEMHMRHHFRQKKRIDEAL